MQPDELQRLNELQRYGVVGTGREEVFDRIARLAARHFGSAIGLVSFIDDRRQWHKGAYGLDEQQIKRRNGLCRYVVRRRDVMVIPDAAGDPGFHLHPRVAGTPHIRFFAGAPIITERKIALGMVAAMDATPRAGICESDRQFLADLAAMVAHELGERLNARMIEREIQARQRIERELQITNTRFRLAIANSPVVLCTEDRELRYTWIANPPASIPPDFIVGKTAEDIWPPEVARDLSMLKRRALEEATLVRGSVYLLIGDHRHRFDVTYEPLFEHGNVVGVCGAAVDVTERYEAQAALKRALDNARAADAAKSRFLAAASHDLRQPVQSLFLLLDVLKNTLEGQPTIRIANAACDALEALRGLLDSLLDVSRLDAGLVSPNVVPLRVRPLLQRLAENARIEAGRKGLQFKLIAGEYVVLSDALLLERILRNLLENALRYTDRGGILVGCRRQGDHVRIDIVDTGHGIPDEKIEEIFQEFVQLENEERDRRKGLGLGLAIVRRLSHLLGHRLSVHSRPGHGTRFSLSLASSQIIPAAIEDEHAPRHLEGRVLVIEDETDVAQALGLALRQAGLEVVMAANANKALASLGEARPEVILADFRLSDGWTGPQAVAAVRDHFGKAIPAVLLTGDTSPESLKQADASGSPLLHKPVAVDRLLEVLGDTLSTART